jgi:hypothetical protein
MWHPSDKTEIQTGVWLGNPKEKDHFEDPGVDRRIILKWILE